MSSGPRTLIQLIGAGSSAWDFSLGQWNISHNDIGLTHWNWNLVFGVTCWALWKDRNSLVFSNVSNMGDGLWSSICNQAHFIANNFAKPQQSISHFRSSAPSSWSKPPQGWMRLYVDRAFDSRNGNSACDRILRNSEGQFVKGFCCKVTSSNALWAKLWGIYSSLKLVRDALIPRIIVETDSKVPVELINSRFSANPAIKVLLGDILNLIHYKKKVI